MNQAENIVNLIRTNYVVCSKCPPNRNCCTFSEYFSHKFTDSQMKKLFSEKEIKMLVEEETIMFDSDTKTYIFYKSTCPKRDENMQCSVHELKKELGLTDCMSFPIGLNKKKVVVDYRCFGIERNWVIIYPLLKSILVSETHDVEVKHYDSNNDTVRDNLEAFVTIRYIQKDN